jgi:hypothetical protein
LDAFASEGRGTRKPRLNAGGGTSRPVVDADLLPRELMLPLVFGLPLLYRPAYVADTCNPWPCKGFDGGDIRARLEAGTRWLELVRCCGYDWATPRRHFIEVLGASGVGGRGIALYAHFSCISTCRKTENNFLAV